MSVTNTSTIVMFGGEQKRYEHESTVCSCKMTFSAFLPSGSKNAKLPVLYYLSGLTCTDLNCVEKSGIQRVAEKLNVIVVFPDTSPRGLNFPGDKERYDFGEGAGMYINATQEPWKVGYNMYSYVTEELPSLVAANLPVDPTRQSIFGHSMGGHGALVSALRNPGKYKSVSAFAPITNPSAVQWGQDAFTKYLGADHEAWKQFDSSELISKYAGQSLDILVDQGTADKFLENQLKPENLSNAAKGNGNVNLTLNLREGYDHSYYFIASFMESHLEFHAARLHK